MRARAIGAAGLAAWAIAAAGQAAAQAQGEGAEPLTERHETFESAVATPAEDLNIRQVPIPEVLQRAVTNPYDMRTMEACDAVSAEVERLDAALGADRDEPPDRDTRTVDEKRDSTAASALRMGIEAVTPYRGVIRHVTGADAYARSVQAAIEAGFARRGFLKGMAVKMNCPPPAAPAWFRPSRTAQYQTYAAPPQTAYAAPRRYAPYSPPSGRYGDDRYVAGSYDDGYRADAYDRAYPEDRYDPYGR